MTDKLKCPFCGTELNDYPDKTTGARMAVCRNPKCKYDGWHFPIDITQRMIDGKKAQDSLKEISRLNQYIRKELAHQIPEESSKADNSIYTITFEIAKECRKGLHNKIEDKSDGR